EACDGFSAEAKSYLDRVRPDAAARTTPVMDREGAENVMPGMEATLPRLVAGGSRIIAVRDLPRQPFDPPVCTAEKGADSPDCAPPLAEVLTRARPDAPLLEAQGEAVVPLEVNDLRSEERRVGKECGARRCPDQHKEGRGAERGRGVRSECARTPIA